MRSHCQSKRARGPLWAGPVPELHATLCGGCPPWPGNDPIPIFPTRNRRRSERANAGPNAAPKRPCLIMPVPPFVSDFFSIGDRRFAAHACPRIRCPEARWVQSLIGCHCDLGAGIFVGLRVPGIFLIPPHALPPLEVHSLTGRDACRRRVAPPPVGNCPSSKRAPGWNLQTSEFSFAEELIRTTDAGAQSAQCPDASYCRRLVFWRRSLRRLRDSPASVAFGACRTRPTPR